MARTEVTENLRTKSSASKQRQKRPSPAQLEKKIPKILSEVFGMEELRDGQEDVIRSVLRGKDTLAVMPTGAGKSLCYQIPALLLPGTTVIVSPLISLMKDQKEKMDRLEREARELNSTYSDAEIEEHIRDLKDGEIEFLFVTPEKLEDPAFVKVLRRIHIDLVVIDEAHCITEWGHDFRPAYLHLKEAIENLGRPPVLALTATATPAVIKDVREQLGLDRLNVIYTGVMRENLFYEAFVLENEEGKRDQLQKTLNEVEKPAIIYTSTVKQTNELFDWLNAHGLSCSKYHGRLSAKERTANQDAFMNGDVPIMVATTAFGLGIDKANVRAVIHYNFPATLEAYYQESGRAGRDGEPARCTLLYLRKDKSTQSFFLAGRYPAGDDIEAIGTVLKAWPSEESIRVSRLKEQLKSLSKKRIELVLTAFMRAGFVEKIAKDEYRLARDWQTADLQKLASDYRDKEENDSGKLKSVIIYAQTALCRWRSILNYFDETPDFENCRHCDNCLTRPETTAAAALH